MYSKKQKRASRMMMQQRNAYRRVHFKNQPPKGSAPLIDLASLGPSLGGSIVGMMATMMRGRRSGGRSK